MNLVTLHRAQRIVDSIQDALKKNEPKVSIKLSVFSENPADDIKLHQQAVIDSVARIKKLLEIRMNFRAAIYLKNAEVGISNLLADQARLTDMIAVLARMPGVATETRADPEEDYYSRRRTKKLPIPAILDVATTLSMAAATKQRFIGSDGAVTADLDIGAVDADMAHDFRRMIVSMRRELDVVSDQLRPLNSSNYIEVSDDDMNWLATHEVV